MIATSLSTQSCPTGLCGQCGPCRREMREADRLMMRKVQAPIEFSPSAREIMAEDRKRERRTRRPIAKVQNRRKPTTPPKPTTTNCANCGQHRALHNRGMGKVLDGHGNLCAVCHDTPQYQARLKQLQTQPLNAANSRLAGRLQRRLERTTRNGRPYHPNAPHGTPTGYTSYGCRCHPCATWRINDDRTRRGLT